MLQNSLFLLAGCFYLASLTQTAFIVQRNNVWPGWAALLFGGIGLGAGKYTNLVWLANLLVFAAWYCHSKVVPAVLWATLSLLLALSFKFCSKVVVSEGGGPGYAITAIGLGYWLWLAAIATTFVAALCAALVSGS